MTHVRGSRIAGSHCHFGFNLLASALLVACGSDDADVVNGAPEEMSGMPTGEMPAGDPGSSEVPSGVLDPALAATPPMGFNNWNAFGCDVNEALIQETADFFVSSGLKDAGYQYVNIDDCWAQMERGADGRLVPDPVKFPSGIAGVAEYVHSKGLKLGIYGDAGTRTCAGYPGSLGNEELDAQTWADWGVDYIKYDNCFNQSDGSRDDYVNRYTAMQRAILKTGRPIVYSICEWGTSQPWEWGEGVGHLWRTTGDITDSWSSIRDIIAFNAPLAEFAGPGHWNDPDMLEVGNGALTAIEKRTHMGMWAMMAAPLIIGTDLRVATEETLSILEDREIIALNQDPLGVQAAVVFDEAGLMVLSKPLQSGERAVALYNSTDVQALVSLPAAEAGLAAADAYHLHDAWEGGELEAKSVIAAGVPAHGSVIYRVRPLQPSDVVPPSVTVEGSLGTVIPGAEATTLTTRITNRGVSAASQIAVSIEAPAGWTITASGGASGDSLASDAALETTWSVQVPEGTGAGRYPLRVVASYAYGDAATAATSGSELTAAVAVAPADGATPLSTLLPMSTESALGPVEIDTSNGGNVEGDGSLITIGGQVYTRGLGTHAGSRVVYYLGGRCSALTVDVGIDDEVASDGAASFQILADDRVVAESPVLTGDDAALTLTADVTGATLLTLAADPNGAIDGDHADWAAPTIVCGGSTAPTIVQQTLFSFEAGSAEFTIANAGAGGSIASSLAFATDGTLGLEVTSPADGNWFGHRFDAPIDLSAFSTLRYDVKTGVIGTAGEFALEVGPDSAWCQGSQWTWTGASASKTIRRRFD
ncbi:MAG TPA: NPCBM/NEW2 domain-containing protein, partial [Polyangiaceae bacterium]|nr:NPCBM/NEW2 domain-containing protein [Polyangiaceae bacterium]